MQVSLQARALELVRSRVSVRGDIKPLADELDLSYYVIYGIVKGKTHSLDASTAQRIYERLTGRALDIQ